MDCRRKSGHSVRGSQRITGGAEICREQEILKLCITNGKISSWREGPGLLLIATLMKPDTKRIEKLQKIVGKQAIQIEILKKTEEILERK